MMSIARRRRISQTRASAGFTILTLSLVVVGAFIPRPGRAQTSQGSSDRVVALLGVSDMECDCTLRLGTDGIPRVFTFRSRPVVLAVEPGTPAFGVILHGDTIAEIDGVSVLTTDGGRRFAQMRPYQPVTFGIRRGGRMLRLRVTPDAASLDNPLALGAFTPHAARARAEVWRTAPPARPPRVYSEAVPSGPAAIAPVPATPASPRSPRAAIAQSPTPWPGVVPAQPAPGATQVAPPPGVYGEWTPVPATPAAPLVPGSWASPKGWFGFSIRCNNCGWSRSRGDDSPVWESYEEPVLARVADDSPASRAGLRAGDRITHIDGVSIMSASGARKFGAVRPGQRIKLTVVRNGSALTREMTLTSRPEERAVIAARSATAARTPRPLRYTGRLDDVSIEVWSAAGANVERVGDTITITVGGSTVRLKVNPQRGQDH